jgi:formate dehydrogenase maturation protein FdhE
MESLLQDYAKAAANMSDEQKAAIIQKALKQKDSARRRARDQAEAKKKAGIKTLTIEVHGKYAKLFNQVVASAKRSRAEVFVEMLELFKPTVNQEESQGKLFRDTRSAKER